MQTHVTGLEKCPFCGSILLSVELIVPVWGESNPEQTIVCDDCAASAPYFVWNTRYTDTYG